MARKKAKKAKKLSIREAVEKLLRKRKFNTDELLAFFDDNAEAIKIVDELGGLATLIAKSTPPVELIAGLLERGADPNAVGTDEWRLPLAATFAEREELEERQRDELIELLLRHGASVDRLGRDRADRAYSPLDLAVKERQQEVLRRLLAGPASPETIAHALGVALESDGLDPGPILAVMLEAARAHLDIPDRLGRFAIHTAALYAKPQVVSQLLDAGIDVNVASTATVTVELDSSCTPPGGGTVPTIVFPAGFTATDFACRFAETLRGYHGFYDAREVVESLRVSRQIGAERRAARLVALEGTLALLRGRGGAITPQPPRASARPPEFVEQIDACLTELVGRAGGDVDVYRSVALSIPVDRLGPFGYLTQCLLGGREQLLRGAVRERASSCWLGRLVVGDAQHAAWRAKLEHQEANGYDAKLLDAASYPRETHEAIGQDLIVAAAEGAWLVLWKKSGTVARVCEVSKDGLQILGQDPVDFVVRQAAVLLGDPEVQSRAYLATDGSSGAIVRTMTADYDSPPGPMDIDRLGGLPIGVTAEQWPTKDGRKMHHVLTVELRHHPMLREDVAALALFISHPSNHEAYSPDTEETEVLLLTEDQLQRGVVATWPDEIAEEDRLAAGRIVFEPADTLSREELYQSSFIGGDPIWLKEDDDVPLLGFVLQFSSELVSLRQGDGGFMYVFFDHAWAQWG